jgi:hypothetical protein
MSECDERIANIPEANFEGCVDLSYIYKCDKCNAEIKVPPTVSPYLALELAISDNPDWLIYESEIFCSKKCEHDFDANPQKV